MKKDLIQVDDYIKDKDLLEAFYTPYQQKCTIIDELIDVIKVSDGELFVIDYAQLQPTKDSIFIGAITNLDMITKNEDGLLPYDVLKSSRKFDELIASIQDEYDAFNEILELRIKTVKEYNYTGRILNEIKKSITGVIDLVKDIDLSKLQNLSDLKEN